MQNKKKMDAVQAASMLVTALQAAAAVWLANAHGLDFAGGINPTSGAVAACGLAGKWLGAHPALLRFTFLVSVLLMLAGFLVGEHGQDSLSALLYADASALDLALVIGLATGKPVIRPVKARRRR